jgi:hypothetical protein
LKVTGGRVLINRKTLAYLNLILAVLGLIIYMTSLTTKTKIPLFLLLFSLTNILGGLNNIQNVQPKYIGYLSLCFGIILMLLSLSSILYLR